ncbi:KR domain-containing protein [Apiospora sp. TS-2023a]
MPFLAHSSSTSSASAPSELGDSARENGILDDKDYPALAFDGYAESPLSEQLEPIAVVGMGCRLPGGVSSPAKFWDMMINKRNAPHSRVPSSRFDIDAHLHSQNDRPASFNVPGGYFLDGSLHEFDPGLFNISPIEAMWMDPQQRKLLEVVYEAFESAGITLSQMENSKTAVVVGSFTSDFQQMSFKEPDFRHSYAATGVDPGIISARISHVFNLYGPSLTLNTACSSSVYALHQACNALRNRECSGAIAAGTNLILTVDQHMNTAKLGVLSPDSTCHTFDASANGYGRAEGIGAVYLKRLSDAIRDNDPIRAVVRSSAVNSNGKVPNVGITHPNLEGQVQVIRHAYQRGGDLDPRLTGFFECHGTGTGIGDPLEVHAVAQAMNVKGAQGIEPLWIGAVKPNIGHSEAASGLSALIKAVLAVENGIIPPVRGIKNLNPSIDWDNWNVRVPCEPQPFPSHLPVRRVSVNSFGYGGTNGHFIVEGVESLVPGYSHGQKRVKGSERGLFNQNRPYLLPFSAHDKPTLLRNIQAHAEVVGDYSLLDLSYTLQPQGVAEAFDHVAENFSFAEKKKAPTVGFAFTGQGAQWARMGCELMAYYPSFLGTIRRLDQVLGDLPNGPEWTLEDSLHQDAAESRVNEAKFSQPLCTAIQMALVDLLESWGIVPKVTTDGAMMAVGLGAEAVRPYLADCKGRVVVACHNSPALVTLSGDADALQTVKEKLDKDTVFARVVKTGGKAYHSFHMKPAAVMYHDLMHEASAHMMHRARKTTDAVMVSSVTNSALDSARPLDADYWCANLVSPVQFNQAVQTIGSGEVVKYENLVLIEIGPHSALKGPINQICREHGLDKVGYLASIERGGNSASQLLSLAGQLFLRNFGLDYQRVAGIEQTLPAGKIQIKKGSVLVDLPTYQWNYAKDLWAENRQSREHRAPQHPRHDVLGSRLPGGSHGEPTWRNVLRQSDLPWLRDHSLGGEAVFPAAGYFGMAVEAVTQMNEAGSSPVPVAGYTLRDVAIKAALVVPDDDDGIETLFSLQPSRHAHWWEFHVSSCSRDGHWNSHMSGTVGLIVDVPGGAPRQTPRDTPAMTQRATGKAWNQALKAVGFDYGPSFQDMQDVRTDGRRFHAAASSVVKTASGLVQGESRYALHPATIDSCLQLIIVSIYAGKVEDMTCGAVPIQVDEVSLWLPTETQLENPEAKAYSWTDERGARLTINGTQLVANDGQLLLSVEGMRCVSYEAAVPQSRSAALPDQPFTKMDWNVDIDTLTSESPLNAVGLVDLVAMAAWKKPGIRVLEFGALNAAAVCQATEMINYTTAVASVPELDTLEDTIARFDHATALHVDPSLELEAQGLQAGQFDLILPGTMADASKLAWLLSPGGRVVADQAACASLEDEFSVLSLSNGLAIATAAGEQQQGTNGTNGVHERSITIVYRSKPTEVPCKLVKAVAGLGPARLVRLADASIAAAEHVVVACDLEGPLLLTLEPGELVGLQKIVSNASSVTWVTAGGLMRGVTPEQAMASGAARSVTSEMASLDFTTLDLDPGSTTTDCAIREIVNCLGRQIHHVKDKESEYCVANGLVYISRLVADTRLNQEYRPQNSAPTPTPFHPSDKLVGTAKAGKVVFSHDERADKSVGADEVQVQVLLSDLNKEDVLVMEGADSLTTFSHEIYGTVVQKGASVQDIGVGDRVFGFSADRLATFQTVSASMVQKAEPDDVPEELVTLPLAYGTALYGLQTLARVEAGEVVLILHGAGAAGAAAISVSKYMKAQTYVAVRSAEEAAQVAAAFDLPAENVIPQLDSGLMTRFKERTGGRPADVIFSSAYASPSVTHECWRAIAAFGRMVEVGRKTGRKRGALDAVPTTRGASYLAFDILDLYQHKGRLLSDLLSTAASLYRQKLIPALGPIERRHLAEFDEAVAGFTDDFTAKKTVIEYTTEGPDDAPALLLPVMPSRPKFAFRPDATYFLVGCLGGLGRSLTAWMVERGARRFAFMSRSGLQNEQAAAWIRGLEDGGVTCQIIRGDASKKDDVEAAVRSIPPAYPVRGLVHAAMVLRDGLFHAMPFDNWQTSVAPKVLAAINLDRTFAEADLDFFVLTSSTSGILGTPGQANYAAGNSFLDSLARHRVVTQHRRACSLVLPMVQGVGVVAENPEIEAALRRKGIYGINETHLLEAFEAAVAATPGTDHIVVGMDPGKLRDSLAGSDVTDSFWTEDARFRALLQIANAGGPSSGGDGGGSGFTILKAVQGAGSLPAGVDLVSEHFTAKLSRLLLIDADVFEPEALPIVDYGLDSMIGAELRNWIFKEYGLDMPFQQLLGPAMTIAKFATVVCTHHGLE